MRVTGLFAGIGGFEVGFTEAGHTTELLCEIWRPAHAVLSKHFPGIELSEDVATLRSLPERTEIVTAGFPCQDLSQAGGTAGIDGSRSGLVSHVFRLIDTAPPPIVVLENVPFMLHLARGSAMASIVGAFEERSYRWAYRTVNSQGFVPQRRERVLFVATRCDLNPWDVLLADDTSFETLETSLDTHAHGFYWTEGTRGLGWAPNAVPTLKNGSTVGIPSPPAILLPDGSVIKPDIRDAERLQGFEEGWTEPAEHVGRAGFRWSLIGSAVTVQVARWLGRRIAAPGDYRRSRDFSPSDGAKWPRAARFDGKKRHGVEIGKFPVVQRQVPLHEFLKHTGTSLSARATRGFLSRADASTLRFRPGFKERLRTHLATMERGLHPDSIAAE